MRARAADQIGDVDEEGIVRHAEKRNPPEGLSGSSEVSEESESYESAGLVQASGVKGPG